jgi:protoporphyrinogen IX oxidase
MIAWTVFVHIFGQMLWVGGLLATSMTLVRHARETSAEGRAALARVEWLFLRGMADVGALLTIAAGIYLFTANLQANLRAPWLHVKLVFVVILLGLHGWIATRSKFFSTGRITLQPGQARMLVVAVIVVVLLILIFTLPGRFFLA